MTDIRKRLDAATADLATAERAVIDIAEGESAASTTASSYSKWRAQRANADIEIERLRTLVKMLSADAEAASAKAAVDTQAKLEADAEAHAETAAAVISAGLARINEIIVEVMTAIVESEERIQIAQRGRLPQLPRLQSAEHRARGGEKKERVIISDVVVEHWAYPDSDRPLDENTASQVRAGGSGEGTIRAESHTSKVVKRKFRQIEFLPEEAAAFFEPLAEVLAIPAQRAGELPVWAPEKHATFHTVLRQMQLKAVFADEPDRRRPQTEFVLVRDDESV